MAACPAWLFRVFHVFENALSYAFDIFKDETVKAVTQEQKKAIFFVLSGRDTFVCLLTGYGKSLIYQVAPAKTGLISRGEHHSLSWQFLHMPDRKRFRSRQRYLLLRFLAQIVTSVSREDISMLKLIYTEIIRIVFTAAEIPYKCIIKATFSKRRNSCRECSNIMKFSK